MEDIMFRIFLLSTEGFCCTQIMLKLALEEEGLANEDLIRAVHGLCNGIAGTQKTCGVLSGGIAILGLYAGKGREGTYANENFSSMMRSYLEWFEESFGDTNCEALIGFTKFSDGDQSYQMKCGDMIAKSYLKIREILQDHNFEIGDRS